MAEVKTPYQVFLETLSQLEQDQSLYEAQLQTSDELQGLKHEEVIKLGGLLCKRLQKFAEKGQEFADTLPPDFVPKLQDAMISYQTLIVPPKVFGGFCPCLKPARDGPEYDKKLLLTKAKMVAACFLSQAVLVENKGEQHNLESVQYADYVSKMNQVFKALDEVKYGASDKAQELARKKLLAAAESVDRFVQLFGDYGKKEFKQEATRRVRQVNELLGSRPTGPDGTALPIGRRLLVKAQSSMQEIMNSAAAISLTQAKDNLKNLESLSKLLKKSRDLEVAQFGQMEEDMMAHNLGDELARLREECDVVHSEASVKIKDAAKRWTAVKNQSVPRKVVEYEDEQPVTTGAAAVAAGILQGKPIKPADLDPTHIFKPMKKPFAEFATILADGAKDTVAKVKDGAKRVKDDAQKVFLVDDGTPPPTTAPPPPPKPMRKANSSSAASPAPPPSTTSAAAAAKGESGKQQARNTGSRTPPPTRAKTTNMFNPLEAILGDDA